MCGSSDNFENRVRMLASVNLGNAIFENEGDILEQYVRQHVIFLSPG